MPTVTEVSLGSALGEVVKNSATPAKLIGAPATKAKGAQTTATNAAAQKALAAKANAQALSLASRARAQMKTNPAKAGDLVVKALAAKREEVVATQRAAKSQVASKLQAESAKHAAQAQSLQSAAAKARASGQTTKAADLSLHAERQRTAAEQKKVGAQSVMAQPITVPPQLTTDKIVEVGAKYNVRVMRKLSAKSPDAANVSTWLRGIDGNFSEFNDLGAAVSDYGGGAVGMLLAGAELGNLSAFNSGLAGLGDLGLYASEPDPKNGNVYPTAGCVPGKAKLSWGGGVPSGDEGTKLLNTYCDCAYPKGVHASVDTWNRRCKNVNRLEAYAVGPWTQAGRLSAGLPSPDLEKAMSEAKDAALKAKQLAEKAKQTVAPTKPAAPAPTPGSTNPNINPQSQIVIKDEKLPVGPKMETVVANGVYKPAPAAKSNKGLLIGAGVVAAAGAFFALRR